MGGRSELRCCLLCMQNKKGLKRQLWSAKSLQVLARVLTLNKALFLMTSSTKVSSGDMEEVLALLTKPKIFSKGEKLEFCSECLEKFIEVESTCREVESLLERLAAVQNSLKILAVESRKDTWLSASKLSLRSLLSQKPLESRVLPRRSKRNTLNTVETRKKKTRVTDEDIKKFEDCEDYASESSILGTVPSDNDDMDWSPDYEEKVCISDGKSPKFASGMPLATDPESPLPDTIKVEATAFSSDVDQDAEEQFPPVHLESFEANSSFRSDEDADVDFDIPPFIEQRGRVKRGYVNNIFCCDICGDDFSSLGQLTQHVGSHAGSESFNDVFETPKLKLVDNCPEKFMLPIDLNPKLQRKFSCPYCDDGTSDNSQSTFQGLRLALRQHVMEKHSNELSFKCLQCHMGYNKESHLKAHMETHKYAPSEDRPTLFQCLLCKSSAIENQEIYSEFRSPEGLEFHLIHKHLCSEWELKTSVKYRRGFNLLVEEKNAEGKFRCEHCEYLSSRKDNFLRHIFFHHETLSRRKKRFECGSCSRRFFSRCLWQHHESEHAQNLIHCPHCYRSFSTKALRDRHVKGKCVALRKSSTLSEKCRSKEIMGERELLKKENIEDCRSGSDKNGPENIYLKKEKAHTEENFQFACKQCAKPFSLKYKIWRKRYLETHSTENDILECHVCGKKVPGAGEQLSCELCHKVFKHLMNLERHILTFHTAEEESMTFRCPHCPKTFKMQDKLTAHVFQMHERKAEPDQRTHRCSIKSCAKSFVTSYMAEDHCRKHQQGLSLFCAHCYKAFAKKPSFERHCTNCVFSRMDKTTDAEVSSAANRKRFRCSLSSCEKAYEFEVQCITHETKSHPELFSFRCSYAGCDKRYVRSSYLDTHQQVHSGAGQDSIYLCFVCKEKYETAEALIGHFEKHELKTGLKVRCEHCAQILSKDAIRFHQASVHGADNFPCAFCHKTFAVRNLLEAHHKRYHVSQDASNEKDLETPQGPDLSQGLFKCHCGQRFERKTDLLAHRRLERQKYKTFCHLCGTLVYNYKMHMRRVHEEVSATSSKRKHVCYFCAKSFLTFIELVKHSYTHTLEKPFICNTCGADFTEKHRLQIHKKSCTLEPTFLSGGSKVTEVAHNEISLQLPFLTTHSLQFY